MYVYIPAPVTVLDDTGAPSALRVFTRGNEVVKELDKPYDFWRFYQVAILAAEKCKKDMKLRKRAKRALQDAGPGRIVQIDGSCIDEAKKVLADPPAGWNMQVMGQFDEFAEAIAEAAEKEEDVQKKHGITPPATGSQT